MQIVKRGLTHLSERRAALALVGALAVTIGLTSPALAVGGPPVGRIYDCYGFSTSVMNYVGALQLKTKSVYVTAPFRKGNRLSGRAVTGTYKLRGTKLTFVTGPYGQLHWYGKWEPRHINVDGGEAAHIALFTPKHVTAISCYPH